MTAPPGIARHASTTGRPADIRVSKVIRHRLAAALAAAAGAKVRDLDGRLIPAHLTDAELVALLGGRR